MPRASKNAAGSGRFRSSLLVSVLAACAAPGLHPETHRAALAAERREQWSEASLLWSDLHRQCRGQEPEAIRGLAYVLWRGGAGDAARRVIEPGLEAFPEETELWFLAGDIAYSAGRVGDSLAAYEEALSKPTSDDPLGDAMAQRADRVLRAAGWAHELGDRGAVVDFLIEFETPSPALTARASLLLARNLRSSDPARIDHFRRALQAGLGTADDYVAAAALVQRPEDAAQRDLESARLWLEAAARLRPQEAQIQASLADVYLAQGLAARAESAARRAAEIEPAEPAYFAGLAQVVWARGRSEEGLALLRRARELEPDEFLGEWLSNLQKEWEQALDPEAAPTPEETPQEKQVESGSKPEDESTDSELSR